MKIHAALSLRLFILLIPTLLFTSCELFDYDNEYYIEGWVVEKGYSSKSIPGVVVSNFDDYEGVLKSDRKGYFELRGRQSSRLEYVTLDVVDIDGTENGGLYETKRIMLHTSTMEKSSSSCKDCLYRFSTQMNIELNRLR